MVQGRTDAEIFRGENSARLTTIKEKVLHTGNWIVHWSHRYAGGREALFQSLGRTLRDSTAGLRDLLGSVIDITSLKETIAKLQQALDEVQLLSGLISVCASCKKN